MNVHRSEGVLVCSHGVYECSQEKRVFKDVLRTYRCLWIFSEHKDVYGYSQNIRIFMDILRT